MENYFEAGIENLRQKLLVMASHSEKAVNESVQALMQRDHDLALRVKADDDVIDRIHKVVHHDWKNSHPIDLTDAGLMADLGIERGSSVVIPE